jgi:hypothetical protein
VDGTWGSHPVVGTESRERNHILLPGVMPPMMKEGQSECCGKLKDVGHMMGRMVWTRESI